MQRRSVIAASLHAGGVQRAEQFRRLGVGDHIEVPGGLGAGLLSGESDVGGQLAAGVRARGGTASVAPTVELRQQDPQHRRLHLVEARVVTDQLE